MKSLALVCLLVVSSLAQSNGTKTVPPTPVAGESWLNHLHRTFEETSMGKTGRLGPAIPLDGKETPDWHPQPAGDSTTLTMRLRGSDLYRLNCWGCHGESGLGAPPEINSVINPTRAMSTQLVMERMKNRGLDISRADATELANQSKAALLERLHKGGTDMPAFPHLSEPEVHAILAYLKQLAGVPGAEKQQGAVNESGLSVGEHIVKSTCHICHNATGPNPDSEQLFKGVIPPLNTLITRTSLPGFSAKVRSGAPVVMGAPQTLCRGRMPVFYYLSAEEVADAYLYLRLYPPVSTVHDQVVAATDPKEAASRILPVAISVETTNVAPPGKARDLSMIVFQYGAGTAVGLLLAGGFWFTLREVRRLTALSHSRRSLALVHDRVVQLGTHSASDELQLGSLSQQPSRADADTEDQIANRDDKPALHHDDYRRFESSWLTRWIEGEDEAA
jgi:mono/diheme cytochrome c family protein